MNKTSTYRRDILGKISKLLTVAAIGGIFSSFAMAGFRFEMSFTTQGQYATCEYWGGGLQAL